MKKQKPLVILALSVVVLVIAYLVYDILRPRCESIFEQTATNLHGNLDVIKSKGDLFVGREKVQELTEGSQKVALHLKTCCVAQQTRRGTKCLIRNSRSKRPLRQDRSPVRPMTP